MWRGRGHKLASHIDVSFTESGFVIACYETGQPPCYSISKSEGWVVTIAFVSHERMLTVKTHCPREIKLIRIGSIVWYPFVDLVWKAGLAYPTPWQFLLNVLVRSEGVVSSSQGWCWEWMSVALQAKSRLDTRFKKPPRYAKWPPKQTPIATKLGPVQYSSCSSKLSSQQCRWLWAFKRFSEFVGIAFVFSPRHRSPKTVPNWIKLHEKLLER